METAFTTGGVCNGAGEWVPERGLCRCYPLYSGKSDFFDSSLMSSDGLSLGCGSYRPTEIAVWSVMLLSMVALNVQVTRACVHKYRSYSQLNPHRKWYENFALCVLLLELFTITPFFILTASFKISGQTIGTDVSITVFSFLAVSGFQLNLTVTNRKEFQVLTSVLPKQERLRLLNLHAKVQLLSWMVFSTGLAIPSIVSLTLDKTLGPIANLEFVCMLVRNLSVLVWGLVSFASNRIVLWQFNELMRSIADTQSRTALEKMRRDHHSMNRLLLGTGLVFALICIPPIWGYQTYVYALLLAIGTLRHPAYKLRHGEATSSSRDSKLLKSKDLAVAPVLGNDSDRLAEPVVLSALSSKAGDI